MMLFHIPGTYSFLYAKIYKMLWHWNNQPENQKQNKIVKLQFDNLACTLVKVFSPVSQISSYINYQINTFI